MLYPYELSFQTNKQTIEIANKIFKKKKHFYSPKLADLKDPAPDSITWSKKDRYFRVKKLN